MNIIFPSYVTSFLCNCTMQEATGRILEAVACQGNNLNIIKAYFTGVQKIILSSHTGSYLYHNSFMPIIDIEMIDVHGKTQVYALFELKKSTKVVMTIFYVFAFSEFELEDIYGELKRLFNFPHCIWGPESS